MDTYVWIAGDGDWGNPLNWSGPNPPPNDPEQADVQIIESGSYIVTISSGESFQVASLTNSDPGAVLELDGAAALSVAGDVSNKGWLFVDPNSGDGGANLTIGGTLTNGGGDSQVIIGNSSLGAPTTVTLGGLVNEKSDAADNKGFFGVYGSASASATVTITGAVTNSGNLAVGGGANFNVTASGSFTQGSSGSLGMAPGGVVTLAGTTTISGEVGGEGTLALTGGDTTIERGASFSLFSGNWLVSGAGTTVTLNEKLTYDGTFSAGSGATLDLSGGDLTLTGAASFDGATIAGQHILYAEGTTTTISDLTIGGTTTFDIVAPFQETNTVTQSGGDVTVGDASGDIAKLNIEAGTAYNILDNSGIERGTSTSSSITNAGLLGKTGGTGTSVIAPKITNTGTISVSSGTLDLQGAVAGTGTETISGSSILELNSTVGTSKTVGAQDIGFTGGGTLDLTDPRGFWGEISDFAAGDAIDLLGNWAFSSFSDGTLTLVSGKTQHAFEFVGDYGLSDFNIRSGATTVVTYT